MRRIGLLLAMLLLLGGCRRRAQECNAFVSVANREQERVAGVMTDLPSNPPSETRLREASSAFTLARTRVQSVAISDAQLRTMSVRFAENIQAFASTLQTMAERVRTDDRDGYNNLLQTLQRHNVQLSATVERINEYCQQ